MENIKKRETNDETLFAAAVRRKEELVLKDEEKNTIQNVDLTKLYNMNNVEILLCALCIFINKFLYFVIPSNILSFTSFSFFLCACYGMN
jgi:hypothetical protein